ncbi:MAG TPA: aminoacyl-tRNA hydrolase [Firmicutes bacterium]|nr:aminoacyl-tRNA hydrolase [Bacillota bacterium]
MKLIVGLGNPGKKYAKTRHNLGYRVIDKIAHLLGITIDKVGFKGEFAQVKYLGQDVIFFKPTTFMNLSGTAVADIMRYFKIEMDDLLVIYDEMALDPGVLRLRLNGSSGSHNGVQNIIDNLQSDQFKRIRLGIGKPPFSGVDYVLGKPSKEEALLIEETIVRGAEATLDYLKFDFNHAMNHFN